jgi:excisionase family DNA binding protein
MRNADPMRTSLISVPNGTQANGPAPAASPPARLLPRLLSLDAAALDLGVSERFLRTLIGKGQVGVVRLGRRVLVPRAEVDRIAGSWRTAGDFD